MQQSNDTEERDLNIGLKPPSQRDSDSDDDADMGVNLQFSAYWDERCGFPRTPDDQIIHWRKFNSNITSEEPNAQEALDALEGKEEKWMDLRPYMIEFPHKVSRYASVSKAMELFRSYHLRHLVIVNPLDDSIAGIVTRRDLDSFMDYDHAREMSRF